MESEATAHETKVPVTISEPQDHAPSTLAASDSGPAAEMSGAIQGSTPSEPSAVPVSEPVVNGPVETKANEAPIVNEPPASIVPAADPVPEANESKTSQDAEMENTSEVAQPDSTAVEADTEANGTPAAKKGTNGRRKSGGVPEHKNKKLNKKQSKAKITHLDAKPGDYFFARLKSYPPWPSIICDEDILPQSLLTTRRISAMKPDGTYNEDYADGGKKVIERTFPVMFLHTNEFAWIANTDLTPMTPEECKDVAQKGKSKALLQAYEVAAEGHDLDYFKNMLMEHAQAMEAEEQRRQEAAEQKATKAEKKKRKSEAKAEAEDVEMEDADEPEVKKSSKKRKKAADSDDEETEKPVKTPKTTKLKLTTKETPATAEKKTKDKPAKPKADKKKSKAVTSDEEMADAPEEEEKITDPVEARKAREREVLFLRHKLQKGFLSRDQAPQEEDMPQMSQYIKKLENYEDLEVSIIRNTKINKVLKALVKLNTIPRDEEYSFRKRSVELLAKWNSILGAEPPEDATPVEKDGQKSTPTTNGVHDDAKKDDSEPQDLADKPDIVEKSSTDVNTVPDVPAAAITEVQQDLKQPTVETAEPTPVPVAAPAPAPALVVPTAEPKVDAPITEPAVLEKAPESAQAATEVTEAVKLAE